MFYIHWLYRTSQSAIVKIDITEDNYVTKLQDIVTIMYVADNCNQSDYIIKNPLLEMSGMQEKNLSRM